MPRQEVLEALKKIKGDDLVVIYEPVVTQDEEGDWWSHVLVDGELSHFACHKTEKEANSACRDYIERMLRHQHMGNNTYKEATDGS